MQIAQGRSEGIAAPAANAGYREFRGRPRQLQDLSEPVPVTSLRRRKYDALIARSRSDLSITATRQSVKYLIGSIKPFMNSLNTRRIRELMPNMCP